MTEFHRTLPQQARFRPTLLQSLAWLAAVAAAMTAAPLTARAQDNSPGADQSGAVTVEFFTSQACSSCIPAAKYFRELAARDDIVALSWHVDYWNTLQTRSGRWIDPYSSKAYTARQRKYNKKLRKRSSVFTPQMVINGSAEAVGSEEETVGRLIDEASATMTPIAIAAEHADNGDFRFAVGESAGGGNAYLVTFKPKLTTDIKGGENVGRLYQGVNAVKKVQPLGVVRSIGAHLAVAPPAEGYGCALIVQEPGQGRIIAARYCPTP